MQSTQVMIISLVVVVMIAVTQAQVIFRPHFVYKQKQEAKEAHRRQQEVDRHQHEIDRHQQEIEGQQLSHQPPPEAAYYDPYYYYYYIHHNRPAHVASYPVRSQYPSL